MIRHRTLASAVLAAALAIGGCNNLAVPRDASIGGDVTPPVATITDVASRAGHTPDGTSSGRPDLDGQPRPPQPQSTTGPAGHRPEADPTPPSGDDTVHPGAGASNLAPPGERTATRSDDSGRSALTSRHDDPRAAATDIIDTGLADQGLEVLDVAADLMEQAGATATVRVTALHRLNGPPRRSVYELDLERDAEFWTVVAHRPILP